jgi:hypothetical protein
MKHANALIISFLWLSSFISLPTIAQTTEPCLSNKLRKVCFPEKFDGEKGYTEIKVKSFSYLLPQCSFPGDAEGANSPPNRYEWSPDGRGLLIYGGYLTGNSRVMGFTVIVDTVTGKVYNIGGHLLPRTNINPVEFLQPYAEQQGEWLKDQPHTWGVLGPNDNYLKLIKFP